MSVIPKKVPLIAAIVLAAAIALLLPAKPKFSARISWQDDPSTDVDADGEWISKPSYAVFNLTRDSE